MPWDKKKKSQLNFNLLHQVKGFDGISIDLVKSNENKAVITGANTQKVAVVNKNGKLKIRMNIDKIFSGYRTFVTLYFTEELKVIDVNEDARIASKTCFCARCVGVKSPRRWSELELNCQTEQLLVKAVTGGKVTTTGFTDNQDIIINTGGTV